LLVGCQGKRLVTSSQNLSKGISCPFREIRKKGCATRADDSIAERSVGKKKKRG